MTYLDLLRKQDAKKKIRGGGAPTKPTQPGFVSFDGGGTPPVGNFSAEKSRGRAYPITARQLREDVQAEPLLEDFREALVLGRLQVCANCRRYSFAAELGDMGMCTSHGEAWPFVPFCCRDFSLSARPAAPAYAPTNPFVLIGTEGAA